MKCIIYEQKLTETKCEWNVCDKNLTVLINVSVKNEDIENGKKKIYAKYLMGLFVFYLRFKECRQQIVYIIYIFI